MEAGSGSGFFGMGLGSADFVAAYIGEETPGRTRGFDADNALPVAATREGLTAIWRKADHKCCPRRLPPPPCPRAGQRPDPEYASVIYIGSAPDCAKNRAYLPKQKEAFLAGRPAPDFAAMDLEVDFKGRATVDDLTEVRCAQMGL